MYILKIITDGNSIDVSILDDSLQSKETEILNDVASLNFYIQSIQKKYDVTRGVIIVHNKQRNDVKLFALKEGMDFFFNSL